MICASAPGKLLLFGEHSVVYGHPSIVTAVDQRISVCVKQNGIDAFHLNAPDLGLTSYTKKISDLGTKDLPKAVRFVEMLYKRFLEKHPQKEGIVVSTSSQFKSTFGFGSSSAVTVAFAKALTTLYQIDLTQKQLFDLCYQAVIDVQGVGSGFDIAAAIWGGTLYYVSPGKVVDQIPISNLTITVGYTGIKADTPTLVRIVASKKQKHPDQIKNTFEQISQIVDQGKLAIQNQNWNQVGKLMTQNQALLETLEVSSLELDNLITSSRQAGSPGAKLSGAGGGDCMLAIHTPETKQKIASAIKTAGGQVMPVGLNAPGVKIETK